MITTLMRPPVTLLSGSCSLRPILAPFLVFGAACTDSVGPEDAGLEDGGADWPHAWLPDGRRVFHHQKAGAPQTLAVELEGGELWQITDGPGDDWNAIWVGGQE